MTGDAPGLIPVGSGDAGDVNFEQRTVVKEDEGGSQPSGDSWCDFLASTASPPGISAPLTRSPAPALTSWAPSPFLAAWCDEQQRE